MIVHQLTALSGRLDLRRPDRFFAMTNRLRTEGTDYLLAAGRAVGARRFVAQSYAGWPFARVGGPVKDETDPLDPDPPRALRTTLAAIRHLEQAVTGIGWGEGLVLRYGGFYGPGTSLSLEPGAAMVEPVRRRQFPLIGDGAASGRSSTSRTPPPAPRRRLSAAGPGSTRSWTTSPRLCASGSRR